MNIEFEQAGPLHQSFIDEQAKLQLLILARMRSFGIIPVLPAFAGFVPPSFKKHYPEVRTFDPLFSVLSL